MADQKNIDKEGPTGGNGGGTFDDEKNMGTDINGQYFQKIKVTYGSFFLRQLIITTAGGSTFSHGKPYAPDGKSDSETYDPIPDDLITQIDVYTVGDSHNNYVTGIHIATQGGGSKSFGNVSSGPPQGSYQVPAKSVLKGFIGREGDAIDALGVIFEDK